MRDITKVIHELMELKERYGFTYDEISAKSGVSRASVQKMLTGVSRSPRQKNLNAVYFAIMDMIDSVAIQPRMTNARYDALLDAGIYRSPAVREVPASYGETAAKPKRRYTYKDLQNLPEGTRAEVINGELIFLETPTVKHNIISSDIYLQLRLYLDSHNCGCEAFLAPQDVQLTDDDTTVVEPDLFVLCDMSMLGRPVHGAPAFVVEVLSPSTKKRDMEEKRNKYRDAGVREYWAIDPIREQVIVWHFGKAALDPYAPELGLYTFHDKIPVGLCPEGDLYIDFEKIYARIVRLNAE